jgi:hypothetical protein
MKRADDPDEKVIAPPAKDADTAAATARAAAKVPDAVDRAGDTTPTKPGTEASRASSGTNERLELREHPVPETPA